MRTAIVGALIQHRYVTNSIHFIRVALEKDEEVEFLSQGRMQFMGACDLGPQWEAAAKWPVLFYFEEDSAELFTADGQPVKEFLDGLNFAIEQAKESDRGEILHVSTEETTESDTEETTESETAESE